MAKMLMLLVFIGLTLCSQEGAGGAMSGPPFIKITRYGRSESSSSGVPISQHRRLIDQRNGFHLFTRYGKRVPANVLLENDDNVEGIGEMTSDAASLASVLAMAPPSLLQSLLYGYHARPLTQQQHLRRPGDYEQTI